MFKIPGVLLVAAGLALPLAAQHDRDDQNRDRHDQRYYDADRKDYHEWNSGEERAWRRYWEERHHAAVEWNRATEEQRREYWRWRHEHPDSMLWPERR